MKLMHTLKQDTLSLSFEVFPPKQDAAFDSVKKATEEIAKLATRLYQRHLRRGRRHQQIYT